MFIFGYPKLLVLIYKITFWISKIRTCFGISKIDFFQISGIIISDIWKKWINVNSSCHIVSACVRAHGGHFENILWCFHDSACYVNAENFWIRGLTVWLFCLSPKCNLSETFYQIWALGLRSFRWTVEDNNHRQTRMQLSPKSLCQKLERFSTVAVWWRYAKK